MQDFFSLIIKSLFHFSNHSTYVTFLTHQPTTTKSRGLRENPVVPQLDKKFPAHCATSKFIAMSSCSRRTATDLHPRPNKSGPLTPIPHSVVFLCSLRLGFLSDLQPSGSPTKLCMYFSYHACRISPLTNPPKFQPPNSI